LPETLRCKLKKGDVELEIEGQIDESLIAQVTELLQIFKGYLVTASEDQTKPDKKGKRTRSKTKSKPKSTKAGRAQISPEVDKLIEKKWIHKKTVGQVVKELQRLGVSNVTSQNVNWALKSNLGGKLTRETDPKLDQYVYSMKESE